MTHQLDTNKSNDSTHAQDVSKDARVFDVEKLAREAGAQHDVCDRLCLRGSDEIAKFARLVLEEAARLANTPKHIALSFPKCSTSQARETQVSIVLAIRALAAGVR